MSPQTWSKVRSAFKSLSLAFKRKVNVDTSANASANEGDEGDEGEDVNSNEEAKMMIMEANLLTQMQV